MEQQLKDKLHSTVCKKAKEIVEKTPEVIKDYRVNELLDTEDWQFEGWMVTFRLNGKYSYGKNFFNSTAKIFEASDWEIKIERNAIELMIDVSEKDAETMIQKQEIKEPNENNLN